MVAAARVLVTADATSRLAAATEWLEALGPDAEALVVAASWDACDDLRRRREQRDDAHERRRSRAAPCSQSRTFPAPPAAR